MPENNEVLLDMVNNSGFLFQTRVEREIETTMPKDWRPIAHEHRWIDSFDGKEGYIDLILEYGIERIVVECKKTTDATWVFLVQNNQDQTNRARLLWTYEGPIPQEQFRRKITEWHNFRTHAKSLESSFCVIRGQGEKDTPMLERLSSYLLRSVESLANEELEYKANPEGSYRIYFPAIITNTTLFACQYDPSRVDISTGHLNNANFTEVPSIRFRKNLSSSIQAQKYSKIEQANLDYERTVFVINSNHIIETLKEMKLPYEINSPWPWENLNRFKGYQ